MNDIPEKEGTGLTSFSSPSSSQVVKRILFTRTEITIYPNGQAYQKSTSWFDKQVYEVKKKESEEVKATAVKKNKLEEI